MMACPRCNATMRFIDDHALYASHFVCDGCDSAWHFVRNHKRAKPYLEMGRKPWITKFMRAGGNDANVFSGG